MMKDGRRGCFREGNDDDDDGEEKGQQEQQQARKVRERKEVRQATLWDETGSSPLPSPGVCVCNPRHRDPRLATEESGSHLTDRTDMHDAVDISASRGGGR